MGMAASQARFLGITARKTNTEFEGQQVNQQRTALANQSANLFNQMLALQVPSPPSKSDSKFTKTVYSFIDDTGEKATIQSIANNPDKTTKATYPKIVKYTTSEIQTKSYRNSLNTSYIEPKRPDTGVFWQPYITVGSNPPTEVYKLDYKKYTDELATKDKIYNTVYAASTKTSDAEKIQEAKDATRNLYRFENAAGEVYFVNAPAAGGNPSAIYDPDGHEIPDTNPLYDYTFTGDKDAGFKLEKGTDKIDLSACAGSDDYSDTISSVDKTYIDNIRETFAKLQDVDTFYKYTINDVSYYIPGGSETVTTAPKDTTGTYGESDFRLRITTSSDKSTYPYGYYNKDENVDVPKELPAAVTYDATGRLQSIILKDGENTLNFAVSVNSITDEDAYEDAMNKYKYDMAAYEKEIEDINAKCKAIQEQDRTLELRLKQLDTEQEALTQEMDAIKKVIDKNVETTFKTFA